MEFAFENYGWWLLVIPACLVLAAWIFYRSDKIFEYWLRPEEYTFYLPLPKLLLRVLGVLLVGIALVGPYWGRVEQKVNVMGREIYFLVDVSASMNAEDIKPSRLDKVKTELKKMVRELRGDKMGLIVFTKHAYVQCPLTNDHNAVNMFIDLVKTDQFANTGTDFRSGLVMAHDRFTNTEKTLDKITRSIVLISDGEDFGSEYTSVVDRLRDEDIKVFTVGVGTQQGAPVPNIVLGKKRGYKKGTDGKPAVSKVKPEGLRALADQFGTEYYPLDEQIDDLSPVAEQVKLLSASVMDSKTEQINNNRYQWFGAIGFIMLGAALFWKPWGRRTEVMHD